MLMFSTTTGGSRSDVTSRSLSQQQATTSTTTTTATPRKKAILLRYLNNSTNNDNRHDEAIQDLHDEGRLQPRADIIARQRKTMADMVSTRPGALEKPASTDWHEEVTKEELIGAAKTVLADLQGIQTITPRDQDQEDTIIAKSSNHCQVIKGPQSNNYTVKRFDGKGTMADLDRFITEVNQVTEACQANPIITTGIAMASLKGDAAQWVVQAEQEGRSQEQWPTMQLTLRERMRMATDMPSMVLQMQTDNQRVKTQIEAIKKLIESTLTGTRKHRVPIRPNRRSAGVLGKVQVGHNQMTVQPPLTWCRYHQRNVRHLERDCRVALQSKAQGFQ